MNRRSFLTLVPALSLIPGALSAQTPDASPVASPVAASRPAPVDLGSGITLLDYRVFPSPDKPRLLLEIRNDGDHTVDAPAVAFTLPDLPDGANTGWASPYYPALRAGSSTICLGILPGGVSVDDDLAGITFQLCAAPEVTWISSQTDELQATTSMEVITDYEPAWYTLVTVSSTAETSILPILVRGIVRDADERVVGGTLVAGVGPVTSATPATFEFWVAPQQGHVADPYVLLGTTPPGSVSFEAFPVTPPKQLACPALFP